jgi:Mrp family chromosome partitioning ATPase
MIASNGETPSAPTYSSPSDESTHGLYFWWQSIDVLLFEKATRVYNCRGEFVVDESPFEFTSNGGEDDSRLLLQSIISSIQSEDMRDIIAQRLNIPPNHISFLGFDGKAQKLDQPDEVNIDVTSQRTSRVAMVEADTNNPAFGAKTVEAVLDELLALNQLGGRINAADQRIKVANDQIQQYAQEVSVAQNEMIALRQKFDGIKTHLQAGGSLETSPAFADDAALLELVKKRIEAEAAYHSQAQVSVRGEQLVALKGQLDDVLQQIDSYLNDRRIGLESSYNEALANVTAIQANLKEQNDILNSATSEKAQLKEAIGNAKLRRQLGLFNGGSQSQSGVIVILDQGRPALWPSKPNPLLYGAIGLVLAGVLAPALMFLRHNLDQRVRSPQQIEWSVGVPCLAVLPKGRKTQEVETSQRLNEDTLSGLGYLRNQLLRGSLLGERNQIIAFTDLGDGPSQSGLVAQLGWLMAQAEKRTLLIDLDFQNPQLHKILQVPEGRGLSDWVSSEDAISNYISSSPTKNLGLIQLGKKPADLDLLFSRRSLAASISELTDYWAFIFIFAPSLLKVHHLLLAAPLDTPVVSLAHYNEASLSELREEVARCDSYHFRFAGVVLHHYPSRSIYRDKARIGAHQYVFERRNRSPAVPA